MQQTLEEATTTSRRLAEELDNKAREHRAVQHDLQRQIDALEAKLKSARVFRDTEHAAFNALNVPTVDAKGSQQLSEFKDSALRLVREFVASLSNLYTYLEERARTADASSTAAAYGAALNEHARFIKPVGKSMAAFHEGQGTLQAFVASLAALAEYLSRVHDCALRLLQEESATASASLQTTNAALGRSLVRKES